MNDRMEGSGWNLHRGVVTSVAFVTASLLHIGMMSPNTSWEHHPLSGPLIVLHAASRPVDYVIGVMLWLVLGAGLCMPAFRASICTAVMCIVAAILWVSISIWAALIASA
jgi:hypothetical protein